MSVRSYLNRFNGVRSLNAEPDSAVVPATDVTTRKGLSDTMNFSFVANSGIPGFSFGHGNDMVNFIHRPGLALNYFGIVYSADPTVQYTLQFQTATGIPVHTVGLPPADGIGIKTLSEVLMPVPLTTEVTRLMRIVLQANDSLKRIIVYSIMIGYN